MIIQEGPRLILRDLRYADLEPLAHWLHPEQAWHRLDGPYYPKMPAERIPAMIGKRAEAIATNEYPPLRERLMIARRDSDALLGMVTRYWISEETNWVAIGIAIYDPEMWGKGYGYEALGLWCAYLFANEPRFVRLDLRTWSGNLGMMRVAEKLGFQQEAVFRKARIVDGEYYDGLGYGILREEWTARYPGGFADSL